MFALGLMTIISVGIGFMFKQVPDAIKGSVPIGEYLGIALLIYFGLRTLKVGCVVRRCLSDLRQSHLTASSHWRTT